MRIVLPMATLVALLVTTRLATAQVLQPSNLLVSDQPESAAATYPRAVDENAVAAAWEEELPPELGEQAMLAETTDGVDDAPLCGDLLCGDEVGMEGLIASRSGGEWAVLTELTTLFPSYSTATLATANEHPILGPRVSVGWESDRGFGIRGRGWGFDGDSNLEQSSASPAQLGRPYIDAYDSVYAYYYGNVTPAAEVVAHQINISGSRFDLDFYKRVQHSTGDVAFGASVTGAHLTLREQYTAVRYDSMLWPLYRFGEIVPPSNLPSVHSANYSYTGSLRNTTYQGGQLLRNRGAGLGVLAEGTHRFYETPYHIWSVFGRGRIAYLIGRWDEPYSNTLTEGDGNMAIGEAALGIEYRRPFRYADLSIQCAFEVQSWDVSIAERINLAGVTTGAGLSW